MSSQEARRKQAARIANEIEQERQSLELAHPMTVSELRGLLQLMDGDQCLVFSDKVYGDFDLIGLTGAFLSEDNFVKDRRHIMRLRKRV